MNSLSREIIDLDRPDTWPSDLVAVLSEHHATLLSQEVGPLSSRYDAAIYSVVDALQPYSIVGWHCTRLADHEVEDIKNNGMTVLDIGLVSRRIGTAVRTGLLSASHGDRLTKANQAAEKYRAGMLWFCFSGPASREKVGSAISSGSRAARPSITLMTPTRKLVRSLPRLGSRQSWKRRS